MDVNSEPFPAGNPAIAEISHRRILIGMAVVIVIGATGGLFVFSVKVGVGVVVGGLLAFVNYYWQKHSIKAIFDRAVHGHKSRFLAARYILRYAFIGLALGLIYLSGVVSIYAVIFGLASFATAVLAEGFISIFSGNIRKESY